jgi:NET1-associated nuclear protein 1 (U3 small nucleolar RNA-associated protein 17)
MGIIHMTVAPMDVAGRLRDILFTTEEKKDGGWRITAHQLTPLGGELSSVAKTIYTSSQPIHLLKAAADGTVIVAASEARVLMGCIRSKDFRTLDEIKFDFRIFQSTDFISCLDVRVAPSQSKAKAAKSRKDMVGTVDVVIGDVKGSIFIHNDLLAKLVKLQHTNASIPAINILPRKLHWHRKSVGSVKWSLDGKSRRLISKG